MCGNNLCGCRRAFSKCTLSDSEKKGTRTLAPFVQTGDAFQPRVYASASTMSRGVFQPRVYASASAMSRGVFQQPVPTSTSAMTVASFRRY